MSISFEQELLSDGIQVIDLNNGIYTFFTELSSVGNIRCNSLFNSSISVGSVFIARVQDKGLSILIACNASSSILTNNSYKMNNIQWREITDIGVAIVPRRGGYV